MSSMLWRKSATPGAGDLQLSSAHLWVGIAILVLLVIRLVVRLFAGTPDVIGEPGLATLAATAMHWLFYALLVIVPLTGLLAKYVGDPWGDIHTIGKPVFIGLTALHAGAALYHHFILKDETLVRMLKPRSSRLRRPETRRGGHCVMATAPASSPKWGASTGSFATSYSHQPDLVSRGPRAECAFYAGQSGNDGVTSFVGQICNALVKKQAPLGRRLGPSHAPFNRTDLRG